MKTDPQHDGKTTPSRGNGAPRAATVSSAPPDLGDDPRPRWRRIADEVLDRVDTTGLSRALLKEAAGLARHPARALGAATRFAAGALVAAGATVSRAAGAKTAGAMAPPAKDRRFADKAWEENAFFFGVLQAHLLREKLAQELVDAAGLDEISARKARLASQLAVDATAPSNFLVTNPAALRRALDTGGLSLMKGLRNFLDDVRLRGGWPRQFDGAGFQVGKNLAVTPGKVVYRNDVMELIQYAPQTAKTYAIPLLASPPWINKYYIMDLAPGRSFLEWAVKHGHTTFAISYRNPDRDVDLSLEDYLLRGPVEAARVVREITGAPKINLAALCLGGTLATIFLAWLAENGHDVVNCVTLTNTLVDFTDPGILGCFTDAPTQATIARRMARRGFLDAEEMSRTFNIIRANDLVFSYVGTSWLAGEDPPAFDLLAWNDDGTRMPAKMHTSYLQTCYAENQLARGEMVIAGKRLDLRRVTQDAFVLAAIDDHIAPWRTQFRTVGLLGGKSRFVLSTSGHIAGIVNPPSKSAAHWVNPRAATDDPEVWLAGAEKRQETWWEEWSRWIATRAGDEVAPPRLGSDANPPLMDAPGLYVHGK